MSPEELFEEHKARLEAGQPAPLKLALLEPQFIRYDTRVETWDVIVPPDETWRERGCPVQPKTGPRNYKVFVASLAEAQGLWFLCPKCFEANQGNVGTHWVEVSFAGRGVTDDQAVHNKAGTPVFWTPSGSGFNDLTTQPSILIEGGCEWHGFITNGEIR